MERCGAECAWNCSSMCINVQRKAQAGLKGPDSRAADTQHHASWPVPPCNHRLPFATCATHLALSFYHSAVLEALGDVLRRKGQAEAFRCQHAQQLLQPTGVAPLGRPAAARGRGGGRGNMCLFALGTNEMHSSFLDPSVVQQYTTVQCRTIQYTCSPNAFVKVGGDHADARRAVPRVHLQQQGTVGGAWGGEGWG